MPEPPLGRVAKARLALEVWRAYARVRLLERRLPLTDAVARIGAAPRRPAPWRSPERLARAVDGCLWPVGPPPRCLFTSLTLYRLLRRQGDVPELVIGLPERSGDHRAHAWVELAGEDVGPPPGRGANLAMARYG